jgi:hypothetical protein
MVERERTKPTQNQLHGMCFDIPFVRFRDDFMHPTILTKNRPTWLTSQDLTIASINLRS